MSQHFRIFLSSPGDVSEERALAIKVIDELSNAPSLKDRVTLEAVAWDKPGAPPMEAGLTPQEAINAGLSKPSGCDVVVVIFWSRMGTPLEFDGQRYLSGTHYEYEEAMAASRATGKPRVLVYRRTDKPMVALDDPDLDEKRDQYQQVKRFFVNFTDHETGKISGGYNTYRSPDEFAAALKGHLLHLLERLADTRLQDELDSLLAEFLSEDTKDYRKQAIIERWSRIGETALPSVFSGFKHYFVEMHRNNMYGHSLGIFSAFSENVAGLSAVLIDLLGNSNANVRRAAARQLGELGDPVAIQPLIECLSDVDAEVRKVAVSELGELKDLAAVQPLIESLSDVNENVRDAAARALAQLGDPIAVPHLIERLTDRNADVRAAAVFALGRFKASIPVQPLIEYLSDENDELRANAVFALGQLGDPTAVQPLIACLMDANVEIRLLATLALGQLGDPAAVHPLIQRFTDENLYVVEAAVNTLRDIGTPEALAAVEKWEQKNKRNHS